MPRPLSAAEIAGFRDRLIEAATRHFATHGADGVTMRGLAGELGVSPMTPYRYFKDKDAILAAVQARAFDQFADALETPFRGPGSAADRARAVGRAYEGFAFAHPESYRLIFDIGIARGGDYPDLERAAERARNTMTQYIRALVEDGAFEGDPELIGHVFWATIHGAVMLKLAGKLDPHCDYDQVIAEATRALAEGFRKKS